MEITRDSVLANILEIVQSMQDEWDDSSATSDDSYLFGNLNWRSIEVVYLVNAIQQTYKQTFPFPEFLQDIERRDRKDVRVGELVDFVYENLSKSRLTPSPDKQNVAEAIRDI
jgi:acyl carrier protein